MRIGMNRMGAAALVALAAAMACDDASNSDDDTETPSVDSDDEGSDGDDDAPRDTDSGDPNDDPSDDAPASDDDAPASDDDAPASDDDAPASDDDAPASDDDAPASDDDATDSPGVTDDTADDGVRDPNVVVEPSEEFSAGLEPRDSTLTLDQEGDVRWLFTIENTTDEPVCSENVQLKLYDEDGNVLAGNDPDQLTPEDGSPIFIAAMTGSPHQDGRGIIRSCIGPGERGIGRGGTMALDLDGLTGEQLLEKAARIEYFFYRRLEGFEPAGELFTIASAELSQTGEGAVVSGEASNEVALASWTIHAALYDDEGKLIDFVSTTGGAVPEGEGLSFELPAGSGEATRFEIYRDAQSSPSR